MPRLREYRWDAWAQWAADAVAFDQPDAIAIDTETSGLGFYDEPFCATLTWRSHEGALRSAYISLEAEGRDERIRVLRGILAGPRTWVFHNAKFDLQKLALVDALPPGWGKVEDTATIQHLLDENARKGLKHLAATVLKIEDTVDVVTKSGPNKGQVKKVPREAHHLAAVRKKMGLTADDGYFYLPRGVIVPYAIKDTEFTLLLYERLKPRLERLGAKDPGVLRLYDDEILLSQVLLRMEGHGFDLDMPYLEATTSEYGVKVMDDWDRVTTLTGDPDLSLNSPKQIIAAFAKRGIFLENSQAKTLLQVPDELAKAILTYRSDFRVYGTYLKALLAEHRNGRVHPWFNPTGARTGRMSSSGATN